MIYELGKFFEKKIDQGPGELPDIGYPIPNQQQNEFQLNSLRLSDS